MSREHDHQHNEVHDQGLQFDLQTLLNRRRALRVFGLGAAGAASLMVIGCGDESKPAMSTTTGATTASTTASGTSASGSPTLVGAIPTTATTPASACVGKINQETELPYPGDGTNGPNALTQSGIVRSDIRSSIGSSTKTAEGVPLTINLTIVDTKNSCAPLAGAAIYLWHCDRAGLYSMYSQGVTNENYLRGVQAADANGKVKFTSIFPAAYMGRWPHIHFEVYPSLAKANSSANKIATSQLALPDEACKAVFATTGYEQSIRNHAQTTLANDNVFSDGVTLQMATMTGSVSAGYAAALTVGV